MKFSQKSSKSGPLKEIKNAFEDIGADVVKGTKNAFSDSFKDLNDQFFNAPPAPRNPNPFAQGPSGDFDNFDQFGKGFESFGRSPFGQEKNQLKQ